MAEAIGKVDVVITTALVPGRRAPILVTEQAVKLMKPGSVIVDLAGEAGGNCELSEPGQTVLRHDVKILAPLNVPSTMAEHASQLYARNIQALLGLMVSEDGELTLDFDDEVIAGACITRGGEIVHEGAKAAAGASEEEAEHGQSGHRHRDPGAGRLRRLRGDLEGPQHAAHAADVGHQRDPRDRRARRAAADVRVHGVLEKVLLVIAVAFGTINVIGGFVVTDRMLGMFKAQDPPKPEATRTDEPASDARSPRSSCRPRTSSTPPTSSPSG